MYMWAKKEINMHIIINIAIQYKNTLTANINS